MDVHPKEKDIVTVTYKTGRYIGEVVSKSPKGTHAIVMILAIVKHPVQGDLHQPDETNVPLFHERKALSFKEKANIPLSHVKLYSGSIPEYSNSLFEALMTQKKELKNENSIWASKSLESLHKLEKETYKLNPEDNYQ